jgi:hypothetical protein
LKKLCPFCLATHASAAAAAILLILWAPIRNAPLPRGKTAKAVPDTSIGVKGGLNIVIFAVAPLAVLIIGQLAYQRPAFQVRSIQPPQTASAPPSSVGRSFSILGGKFALGVGDDPTLGMTSAPHVAVCLFDYTCPHCRRLHGYLREAQNIFSNELAIASLAVPLNASCNPSIQQTKPMHADACDFARIGLAMWRISPALARQYDDWIFGTEPPAPLASARDQASRLAGAAVFAKAMQDPWIDQQLRRNTAIYEATFVDAHYGMLPQMFVGSVFVSGPPSSPQNIYNLLDREFGLRKPE